MRRSRSTDVEVMRNPAARKQDTGGKGVGREREGPHLLQPELPTHRQQSISAPREASR